MEFITNRKEVIPLRTLQVTQMSTLVETLNTSKTARLDLKTTEFAKDFIRKAATISGLDMTSFIMSSAFEKAEAVMENYNR